MFESREHTEAAAGGGQESIATSHTIHERDGGAGGSRQGSAAANRTRRGNGSAGAGGMNRDKDDILAILPVDEEKYSQFAQAVRTRYGQRAMPVQQDPRTGAGTAWPFGQPDRFGQSIFGDIL